MAFTVTRTSRKRLLRTTSHSTLLVPIDAAMVSLVYLYNNGADGRFRPYLATIEARHVSTKPTEYAAPFRPKMDVKEAKDSNLVTAVFELPGLESEDIAIDLQQNRLTVSGESKTSNDVGEDEYTTRERRSGKFSRTLQLPFGTKAEDVKAKLENGLLTVMFPKSTPEQQPQHIVIQ